MYISVIIITTNITTSIPYRSMVGVKCFHRFDERQVFRIDRIDDEHLHEATSPLTIARVNYVQFVGLVRLIEFRKHIRKSMHLKKHVCPCNHMLTRLGEQSHHNHHHRRPHQHHHGLMYHHQHHLDLMYHHHSREFKGGAPTRLNKFFLMCLSMPGKVGLRRSETLPGHAM